MLWLAIVLGLATVAILGIRWWRTSQKPSPSGPIAVNAQRVVPRVDVAPRPIAKSSILDIGVLDILDLQAVPSTRMRIRGTSYASSKVVGSTKYLLLREPYNRHDEYAVAVYSGGLKAGYVSAAKAAVIAPLLDQLKQDAFLLGGDIDFNVDVPRVPSLREFVKSGRIVGDFSPVKPVREAVSHAIGEPAGYAAALVAAGTPPFHGFSRRDKISERVAQCVVGDRLRLVRDDGKWAVSDHQGVIGYARWSTAESVGYPDSGHVVVHQLIVGTSAKIIDVRGLVDFSNIEN